MTLAWKEQKSLLSHWQRMHRSGLSLSRTLALLSERRDESVAADLAVMEDEVNQGRSLAQCRGTLNRLFDDGVVELLLAGERAGSLEGSLKFAEQHVDTFLNLRKKVVIALAYPSFVAVCALLLIPIPSIARHGLMRGILRFYLPASLIGVLLYAVARYLIRRWREGGELRIKLEAMLEKIPVLASFYGSLQAGLFFSSLASLLSAGGSSALALEGACRASGSRTLLHRSSSLGKRISQKGEKLSTLLQEISFVSASDLQDLRIGEESGSLEDSCRLIAERAGERMSQRATALAFALAAIFIGLVFFAVIYHILGFWIAYFRQGVEAGLF